MSRRLAPLLAALLALAAGALPARPARAGEDAPRPEVREIRVTGARMVAPETVRARIGSREGAPYDPELVTKDVRAIYELGSIQDVTVDAEGFEGGVRLTYAVVERPVVRSVEFDGNKEASADDLKERAALPANAVYNPVAVADAVARVRALYREKGFYQAVVRTDATPSGEGQVALRFVIEEGATYRLVSIDFRGNAAFPAEELRKQVKSEEWGLFSFLGESGKLRTEVLAEDRQALVTFYQDHGYLEARVGEAEVAVDDRERTLRVVFPVVEGTQYRLGSLALTGDELVPLAEIRTLLGIAEGEVFRRSLFAKGIAGVNQRYSSRGYAFVKVDYATRLHPETQRIDVTFLVSRGPEARVGRVTIGGNVSTRDKVVRRELTFAEGDLFNSDALRRSRQKVMNLGFFDAVDIVPRPREDDTIDIDIEVKERLTGAITFGLGYSSEDKLTGQLRLQESNLFGRGQALGLMVEYSPNRKSYSVSFSEPAILDGKWSAGFSVFRLQNEYDEYDRESVGGKVTVGRALGEYMRGSVTLKHETVTVEITDAESASSYIEAQAGTSTTASVRAGITRDTRDNYFNPTTGNRTSLSAEVAAKAFGGDNAFTRLEVEHSSYAPLLGPLVGMIHGEYGRIDAYGGDADDPAKPPIYEKYFLGGIMSLRGFPYRSVGPKDPETGDAMGGVQQLVFNVEAILPIAPEQGFNLVAFFDTGNAWDKGEAVSLGDFRKSAGVGIRWMSPIGPFRLEWGWILDRREGEPSGDWAFVIGNFF